MAPWARPEVEWAGLMPPLAIQYASVIFTHSEEQAAVARKVTAELQARLDGGANIPYEHRQIATAIVPATVFYPAHLEHQRYLEKNPSGYCTHRMRFDWATVV